MKKIWISLLAIGLIITGCTGSFNVTRIVYQVHSEQPNKWVNEAIFVGCVVFPIYGLATFADAVIFNSIEFWSGRNPISVSEPAAKPAGSSEDKARMSYNEETDTVAIETAGAPMKKLLLTRNESGVVAKDASGRLLYMATQDDQGGVSVYDREMNLVQYHSPQEVVAKNERLLRLAY